MSVWVQRSTSSSVYQTASKCPAEVSDTPAGLFAFCANVIFIAAAIILWDYPRQVHLELEFHICAGSRCLYEPEKFLHSARWMCCCSYSISPSSSIYQDVAKQVGLWLNCFFCPFFCCYNLLPEHTEQDRCIILIYAKPHSQITVQAILPWERWNILPPSKN